MNASGRRFSPEHELGDRTRTGMPVEHAPHRRIDRIPVTGRGSRVAPQKRAQRGHEIIPVRIRRRQGKLIHIRSEHDRAVMGKRHRIRPSVRPARHPYMRIREDTCRGLQTCRLLPPILRIAVAGSHLADMPFPCGAVRFRRIHHVGRALLRDDVDKPAGQCFPPSSGIQFSIIGRRFPFGTACS